nr:hypothetical protein [Tanacetum cinerariifolium]
MRIPAIVLHHRSITQVEPFIMDCQLHDVVANYIMISQSSVPPTIADEPVSPLRDVSQGEACPTDSGFITDQDRATIDKSSTFPRDLAPRVTSPAAVEDKDREGVAATRSGDDAPINGRSMDEGEAATERISDDSEEMATVLTSMDAATVLASGVVDVPTGSGSIPTASTPAEEQVPTGSDVVPTASPVFTTATVVAKELEEQLEREDQRRSEQIARDSEIARIHAEEELQIMIDGLDKNNEIVAKYLQEYHQFALELPMERRIELISDLLEDFIPMGSKEEAEMIKRKGLNLEQESAKKQKTSEEVTKEAKTPDEVPEEKVKEMMQLIPIEEIYVESLQVKHPIIDWKHLDREDLNQLWILVKETLSNRPPTSDKNMELWVELRRLYEPDHEDQLWTHTQNLMYTLIEWKLYDSCGVHHVTSKDKEILMLIEKDYPLRKGLALVMISYKLQVENYSQMVNDLILKIYKIANSPRDQVKKGSTARRKVKPLPGRLHSYQKLRRNCQSKSNDSFTILVPHVTPYILGITKLRIEQYFQVQDYALWGLIENGNSFNPVPQTTANTDDTSASTIPSPVTTEEKAHKNNNVKARSMLLMSLPNKHLLTLSQYKDAKTLFEAIQARFSGNDATKKTQKTLLKQMYENFNAPSTENKVDLDTMSIDDLYNNFKIVKQEVKRTVTTSSSLGSQNMAFLSSPSSTNEVDTANIQVSNVSTPVSTVSTHDNIANLSDATVYAFLANQPNGYQLMHEDLEQIHEDDHYQLSDTTGYDKTKVECFNCHKMGHFARECRSPRNQENRPRNQNRSRKTMNVEDTSSKAMVTIDGVGFDWSYMDDDEAPTNMALMAFSDSDFNKSEFDLASYKRGLASVKEQLVFYKKNEVMFCDQIVVLKRYASFKDSEINALNLQIEKLKKEKESNRFKIDNFKNASKSLDKLIGSQISNNSRIGLGFTSYNVIAPPPTGLFAPPAIDLSKSGIKEFQHPEFKGYGPKAIKSVCVDTLNEIKKALYAPNN